MVSPKSAMKSLDESIGAHASRIIFTLVILFVLSGCALVKLKKEVRQVQASTILVGHISNNFNGKGPIVVAAYFMDQGKRVVAHYSILHDSGEFELMVLRGDYYLYAYCDQNSNFLEDYDPQKIPIL